MTSWLAAHLSSSEAIFSVAASFSEVTRKEFSIGTLETTAFSIHERQKTMLWAKKIFNFGAEMQYTVGH